MAFWIRTEWLDRGSGSGGTSFIGRRMACVSESVERPWSVVGNEWRIGWKMGVHDWVGT